MTVLPARRRLLPHLVEMLEADPVGLQPDAQQLRLHVPERGDRARESRQLDQDDVPRADEHARDQVDPLLRSARDDQLLERGLDGPALEYAAAQTRAAACSRASVRTATCQHRAHRAGRC